MKLLQRRILINNRDYARMRYQCLVVSPCGHRRLYDTCEWLPVTQQGLLITMLRLNTRWEPMRYLCEHWKSLYDPRYPQDYADLRFDHGGVLEGRKRHSRAWHQFGWATVTKINH